MLKNKYKKLLFGCISSLVPISLITAATGCYVQKSAELNYKKNIYNYQTPRKSVTSVISYQPPADIWTVLGNTIQIQYKQKKNQSMLELTLIKFLEDNVKTTFLDGYDLDQINYLEMHFMTNNKKLILKIPSVLKNYVRDQAISFVLSEEENSFFNTNQPVYLKSFVFLNHQQIVISKEINGLNLVIEKNR
ncbi:hypothetical protein OF377_02370 [Ureaplasma sp. ES3154-GEN]|uniref:hypothetical protein n=1 Tax=Ureaplasma sp. ES3154-GEN TaxID=2984844 RepID=UPI0021E7157E|nr:hypothetical protein [Ureaplasma sp. ES3154-GEN]MCV3743709.1 hypothetical protein [Ureaplasma sp. ES3154-GEN]